MKKVIRGKLYDTETAQKLGWTDNTSRDVWAPSLRREDMNATDIQETLYLTKSGNYFIHGEGGSLTRYAETLGDHVWLTGEHIEPITEERAKLWAQSAGPAFYQAVFGARSWEN